MSNMATINRRKIHHTLRVFAKRIAGFVACTPSHVAAKHGRVWVIRYVSVSVPPTPKNRGAT